MADASFLRRAAILTVIVLAAIVVCVLLVVILRPGSGADTQAPPTELSPAAAALAAMPVPEYDEEGVPRAVLHLRQDLSRYQGFVDASLKTLLKRIEANPRQMAQWGEQAGAQLRMLALDTPDPGLRGQALRFAGSVGGGSTGALRPRSGGRLGGVRVRQQPGPSRSQAYAPLILAMAERTGEMRAGAAHYASPYMRFRSALIELERMGAASTTLAHVVPTLTRLAQARPIEYVALAEIFDYLGANDMALAFFWKALEIHASRDPTQDHLYLFLDEAGSLDVVVLPKHGTVEVDGRRHDFLSFVMEPIEGSEVFGKVKAGRGDLLKQTQVWKLSLVRAPGSLRLGEGSASALLRARLLAGLARGFMNRGKVAWAATLAVRALAFCSRPDFGQLQSQWIGGAAMTRAPSGEHLVFGMPSDVYAIAAQALAILGQVDLTLLRARSGETFPVGIRRDANTSRLLSRARKRLLEAYQLAIASQDYRATFKVAYDLVCLDIMERTADGARPAVCEELFREVQEEVILRGRPRRFLGDLPPPNLPGNVVGCQSLRLKEAAYLLAARLALQAGKPALGKEQADLAAVYWQHVWGGVSGEAFRISLTQSRGQSYRCLTALLAGSGLGEEALQWTERVRGQALVELVANDLSAPQHLNLSVSEAMSQGSALCERIAELVKVETDHMPAAEVMAVRRKGPGAAPAVDVDRLRQALPADTCIVDYYLMPRQGWAWVISKRATELVPLAAGQRTAADLVARWREQLETGGVRGVGGVRLAGTPHVFDPKTDAATRDLYDRFVAPVEAIAGTYRHWCIVPYGSLKALSFAALSDGHGLCLDRHSLSYAASLHVLALTMGRRAKRLGNIVCVANPDVGKPEFSLPLAEKEATVVAGLFPESRVFLGAEANLTNLTSAAPPADVLHLACHALPVDDRGNRALWLSPTQQHTGFVRYFDLYRLRTNAFMACLSACSTGLGEETAGDEVLGLSRGFLAAGVPSVVLSLWDVPDQSTSELMADFYKRLRERDVAAALQEAQKATAHKYRAPWHWAAFVVYGDWFPQGSNTAEDTPAGD